MCFLKPQLFPLHCAFLQKECRVLSRSTSAQRTSLDAYSQVSSWPTHSTTEQPLSPPTPACPPPLPLGLPSSCEQEPQPSAGFAKLRVSLSPFLLFSCPSERISSARQDGAAMGTRMEDSQGLHRLSCHPSSAPSPRRPVRAQGQSCPGSLRGTGCGDTAARDNTG